MKLPRLWQWTTGMVIVILSFHKASGHWLLPIYSICYGLAIPFALALSDSLFDKTAHGLKKIAGIIALLLTQIIIIGERFYRTQCWDIGIANWTTGILWILQSLAYGFVAYRLITAILGYFEENHESKLTEHFSVKRWAITILSVKILFFIAFYPCVFGFDAAVGLRTCLDPNSAACDHHPYFVQLIHALAFESGIITGHSSLGFAVLTLGLILSSTLILLYGIHLAQKQGVSARGLTILAATFAFFPLFPYLSVYTNKDGFFAYAFLLYIFTLYQIYVTQAHCFHSRRFVLLHGVSLLLVCLTRHQGLYLVAPEVFLLLVLYKGYRKRILLASAPAIAFVLFWAKCLLPFWNIEPGGKQETLGTLFQQTAYFLKAYPTEVSSEEEQAIASILDKDDIPLIYNYEISDPVKRKYRFNPWYRPYPQGPSMFCHIPRERESEAILAYLSAWFSMGCRHPWSYIKASGAITLGFFYNTGRPLIETEPYWAENPSATNPKYSFFHINWTAERYFFHIYRWMEIPFLNWICAIPYYNWLAILFFALLFYRKDIKGLGIFLPVLMSLGILLICPVAYGRYAYPIVISLPIFGCYLLKHYPSTKHHNNNE